MRPLRNVCLFAVLICQILASAPLWARDEALFNKLCEGENLLKAKQNVSYQRGFEIATPGWTSDRDLIKADLDVQAWGSVRTYFSKDLDTQIFYTATGTPNGDLSMPLVDPQSKAVIIFIHGSGTAKSSGSNFVNNMSTLANLGYSAISMDLPFHAHGSLRNKMSSIDYFMKWFKEIVDMAKAAGKPVYLAGHSFGPEVMFEYLSRYPFDVAGGLAMSPAEFDAVTEKWYKQYTEKMKFGGNVVPNDLGGEWAESFFQQSTWNRGVRPDPTLANPNLRLRILSGDREEYVPAPVGGPNRTPIGPNTYDISVPLHRLFANSVITVEKGVGHYIFDFKDASGKLVVLRELMLMLEDNADIPKRIKEIARQRESRPAAEQVAIRFQTDLPFRSWALTVYNERVIKEIFKNRDDERAQELLNEFVWAREARSREMIQTMANTRLTAPEFYEDNKALIEMAVKKNRIEDVLSGNYYRHLGGQPVRLN
ncbi:MAG: alpha/beta hydrolase [Bdellovibrionales bacterium]